MPTDLDSLPERIDKTIRMLFYILVFWLPYSSAAIEICVISSVVLWLIKRIFLHRALIKRNGWNIFNALKPTDTLLNRPIYFFIVICALSVSASVLWQQSLGDFITKILEWFAVFWIIAEVFKTKKQIYILGVIFLFTSLAVGLDALYQYYIGGIDVFFGYPLSPDGRATASFKAPSGLGGYMVCAIPVSIAVFVLTKKRPLIKVMLLFASAVFISSLVLTFTRGAYTGAFVSVLILAFGILLLKHHIETFKTIFLAFLFLCMIIAFPLFLNTETTLNLIKRSNTVAWRLAVWKDTFKMIQDRPLIGHGVNTYMPIFQSYRRDPHNFPTYAHNCFVQLAAEVGLLGLGGFLWIIMKFFSATFKDIKTKITQDPQIVLLSLGLSAAIIGFLIHSFFDTNFYALQLGVYFWLFVGLQTKITQFS